MKKSIYMTICFIALWQYLSAEESFYEAFRNDIESVFEYVDKNQVPTGLLGEYGFHLVSPTYYGGEPNGSNYVNRAVWEMLYAGMYDSRINDKCQMADPEDVSKQADGGLSIMYYKYNTFAEDALERGLITFEDEKIRIVPGQPSPYVERECFAVMPLEGSLPYVFDKNNFFTNTGLDVAKIEYKIDDGSYREIPFLVGMSHRVPTNTPGEYDITFRVTFSNGKVMESHSIINIPREESDAEKVKDNYGIATLGIINADYSQSGGNIQVKYMKNSPAKGKLVRPLIIVEDMDLSVLSSDLKMDLGSLLSQGGGVGDAIDQLSQLYDIIYIDFNDGLDDLLRNAEMLRKALVMINQNRYSLSDESYIVGLGTGGVIARMAVNMMENANEDHKVQKIISINAPFKGINIPVSIQTMIQHIYEFSLELGSRGHSIKKIFEPYIFLFENDIFKQLLIYNVSNYQLNNQEHNNFLSDKLLTMRPNNCETVLLSYGDYRYGYLLNGYQQIMDISETIITEGNERFGGGADITIKGYAVPNKSIKEVYRGELRAIRRLFKSEKHLLHLYKYLSSTSDMYPVDGASGTYFKTGFINDLAKSVNSNLGEIMKTDKFCFVPTFSALDLDAEKYFAADDLEDVRGEMNADRAYWTGTNSSYTDFSGIIDILMQELVPTIKGPIKGIVDDTELYVGNLPDIPMTFSWNFKNGNFRVVSQDGNKAVVRPLAYGEFDYADTVSVNISVDTPMLSIPPMSTPAVRITPHTIRIDGSSYITAGAQTFELDTLPKNAGAVEWTAGENIQVSRQGEKSATAYATEYPEDAWIEASFAVGDDRYNIRKDLIASRLDSVTGMKMEQTWWDKEVAADKYFFKVELYPIYMPPQEIHFCWSNTVRIYDKDGNLKRENDSNDDDGFPSVTIDPGQITFAGSGMAEIETPGDVGICQFAATVPGLPLITDSLKIKPGDGGGYDHLIMPTSTDYPPGEIDPIITIPALTGPNCAIVTMPALGTDLGDYAAGEIRCDISDDYGNRYRVSYYVRSERGVVYHNYSVSPNPTSDRLDVKMTVEGDASMSEPSPMTVKLYGDTGLVREATFDDPVAGGSIDVSNLSEGTYYMNLEINGTVVKRQVVLIQR